VQLGQQPVHRLLPKLQKRINLFAKKALIEGQKL